MALPGLSLPARLGGATAPARRWHRLGSVSERDWAVQPLLTEVAPPELGLGALAGEVQPPQSRGGTAWAQSSISARRCNLSSQEVQPLDPEIPGFDRFELQI